MADHNRGLRWTQRRAGESDSSIHLSVFLFHMCIFSSFFSPVSLSPSSSSHLLPFTGSLVVSLFMSVELLGWYSNMEFLKLPNTHTHTHMPNAALQTLRTATIPCNSHRQMGTTMRPLGKPQPPNLITCLVNTLGSRSPSKKRNHDGRTGSSTAAFKC